ncbi:hypothetical protein DHW03_11665 [Pedobacter yonginense]|uniref:Right handed beta helix domain-containing protein n=1 Tax=Pedobacter yonginense TaxID=651869 RepID=A0A317EMV6_9SPHI|nr:hypothetical protein [Pedobacter yonginense]PWS28200.1 hypothetical protein DHW03_11665 [Pedobacter yonginense]
MRFIAIFCLFSFIFFASCRKGERITLDPNAKLTISNDSVLFDTIFTSLGSTTQRIKLINYNLDALNIDEIKLSGGNSSPFSININGENTIRRNNLVLNGQDSLNLFIKVTINPNAKNLPFLVQDSIILNSNGNEQIIQLIAYGQNAVFINSGSVGSNTIWNKTLPYVINNSVTIKNGSTLTIEPGSRIYFHKDASMIVEGNVMALGTATEPIQFCSDRLEQTYSDEPGQWKGIYLKQMGNGIIRNVIVKNASVGITSDSLSVNPNPKLILSNSVLKNMQVAGYIGYHSELIGFNNLFYNCGNYLIYAVGGGRYNLKQNTFAGYNSNFARKTAALSFSDYLSSSNYNNLYLELANNIIWGNLTNELDIQKKTTALVQIAILTNLIRTSNANYNVNGNLLNTDPQFMSNSSGNFELSENSMALKKGANLLSDPYFSLYLNRDLMYRPRVFPSSLGCYEKK